jgi:hypothetical protein
LINDKDCYGPFDSYEYIQRWIDYHISCPEFKIFKLTKPCDCLTDNN